MGQHVEVRLLGDVAVVRDGDVVVKRSPLQRTLLALLALDSGTPTAIGTLLAEAWREQKDPKDATAALHVQIHHLKGWLDPERLDRHVASTSGGYVLDLPAERVDLHRFHGLARRVRHAAAEDVVAVADEALALWHGDPFAGCAEADRLVAARVHAQERRRALIDRYLDALLELGRPHDAVGVGLPELVRDPDREPLVHRVVTALHRAGRGAEVIDVYQAYSARLRVEHGVEPGPALRGLVMHIGRDPHARPGPPPPSAPTVVGREEPLARVVDALHGGGRIVVVEGEAGIGKSVLLRAALTAADRQGARVGSGAWEAGAGPLAAWHEALTPLGIPLSTTAPGPALHAELARQVAAVPLLLALDDVHRADSASLAVLTTLARLGLPHGLVLLLGARTPDAVAHPEWEAAHAELAGSAQLERVALDAVDHAAVRGMVDARLIRFAAPARTRLADLLWHRAHGHPLHTAALLDAMAAQPDEDGAAAAAGRVPDRLRPTLAHRVAGLPPATRHGVEALAVLQPVPLAGLARVLETGPLELADRLRPAVDAGVLVARDEGFAVRHDLVADAARDAVPDVVRAHLHLARREDLDRETDAFTALRHAEGAAPLLPGDALARARLDAGVAAYRGRALVEALDLLTRAADALPAGHEPVRLVHEGLALAALGQLARSDDVLDAAVAHPATEPEVAVLAAIGDEWLGQRVGGDPRRLARLHHVEALPLPDPARFELLAALFREEALGGTSRDDLLDELVAIAARLGDDPVTAARVRALEARSLVEASAPVGERLAITEDAHALAHATDDPALHLDATEQLVTACLAAGRVARARELRDDLLRIAERWHRPRQIWAAELVEASLLLAEGEIDAADSAALRGFQRGLDLGLADAARAYGVHQLVRHLLTGTLPALGDLAARAAADAPTIPAWSAAAALVAAAAGDDDEARGHLAEFRRRRAANTSRSFDRPALCLAALASFRLADGETAALVREGLPPDPDAIVHVGFGAALLGPATLHSGLAAWTLGDIETARTEIGRAHAVTAGLGWMPWADAASALLAALDDPGGDLPFGLSRA
ncbi:BTAD domain-containing putative transcriptional regulator [Actinomycetospora sp. CA-101289]|uniref:BTAD domain-containing putative transcriptional regulator n=1 Tax=Actinomycetospora sp. CA-101289 TaxID=3239893 RepID=UPI003D97783A